MAIDHLAVAERLIEARRSQQPIDPLTETYPGIGVEDAYAIQTAVIDHHLAQGDTIAGYKLGLTSRAMQQMLGLDQPDYSAVLTSTVYEDGAEIPANQFIAPKAEAEIAVVLDQDLSGPGVTTDQARAAIRGAAAAVELVDSRVRDWKIKLPDTVADLASCGAIVVSSNWVPIDEFDLRLTGMVFRFNGEVNATGAGAAALDDPVAAVAWAANTLGALGITMKAGHVVMTGSLHAAVDVKAGDEFRADFDRLGSVSARMT